jgi:alpha-glucosidase (family GH31 glycosyl hydrolase)
VPRILSSHPFQQPTAGPILLSQVWPGACYFPDYLNPRARTFFARQLEAHHGLVPWDGIW